MLRGTVTAGPSAFLACSRPVDHDGGNDAEEVKKHAYERVVAAAAAAAAADVAAAAAALGAASSSAAGAGNVAASAVRVPMSP